MNLKKVASTKEYWLNLFESFESSGQTINKFCTFNNISVNKFMYWRKKLTLTPQKHSALDNINKSKNAFQEVTIKPQLAMSKSENIVVILPEGIKIILPINLEKDKLKLMLNTLRAR